jgi:hypothetical protein
MAPRRAHGFDGRAIQYVHQLQRVRR